MVKASGIKTLLLFLALTASLSLIGCGGGGMADNTSPPTIPDNTLPATNPISGTVTASFINGIKICVDETLGTVNENCTITTGQGNFSLQNAEGRQLSVFIANAKIGMVAGLQVFNGMSITPFKLAGTDTVKELKIRALFHQAGTHTGDIYDLSSVTNIDLNAFNNYLSGTAATLAIGSVTVDYNAENGDGLTVSMYDYVPQLFCKRIVNIQKVLILIPPDSEYRDYGTWTADIWTDGYTDISGVTCRKWYTSYSGFIPPSQYATSTYYLSYRALIGGEYRTYVDRQWVNNGQPEGGIVYSPYRIEMPMTMEIGKFYSYYYDNIRPYGFRVLGYGDVTTSFGSWQNCLVIEKTELDSSYSRYSETTLYAKGVGPVFTFAHSLGIYSPITKIEEISTCQ